MKFNYLVRHNGVDYPAGADVPVEETPKAEKKVVEEKPKAEPKAETPKKRK
jgi:hypothetical protein